MGWGMDCDVSGGALIGFAGMVSCGDAEDALALERVWTILSSLQTEGVGPGQIREQSGVEGNRREEERRRERERKE